MRSSSFDGSEIGSPGRRVTALPVALARARTRRHLYPCYTDVIEEPPSVPSVVISEVAPWSSGNSPVAADWFEVTNTGGSTVDIIGWKIDDNSESFVAAVALTGIPRIKPGESVIFIETSDLAGARTAFLHTWFGSNPPAGLQIGSYSGGSVGLSTGGDAVNVYNSTGVLQAKVFFGVSPAGPSFPTFDNAVGLNNAAITQLSARGVLGAFVAANDVNEIGSAAGQFRFNSAGRRQPSRSRMAITCLRIRSPRRPSQWVLVARRTSRRSSGVFHSSLRWRAVPA